MGNLISIHTLIFLKEEQKGELTSPLAILSELLDKYNGMSYNRYPIYIKEGGGVKNRFYKISYGEKGAPRELIKFANSNQNLISQIFARTYYESGDLDYFVSTPFSSSDYEQIRQPCRYGFDEIKFKLKKGEKLRTTDSNPESIYNQIFLKGEMNSISDLIEQDDDDILANPKENYSSVHAYAINNLKTTKPDLLDEILYKSDNVLFLYNGKTVHQKIRTNEFIEQYPKLSKDPRMIIKFKNSKEMNEGYFDFYSCGWSNCINEKYLNYIQKPENKTDT